MNHIEEYTGERLKRLGAGESISALCSARGISRPEFDNWWREQTRRRVPSHDGQLPAGVSAQTRILRNRWGVPHIQAQNDEDLFFAFGYAMAQDRLFQLDYLRRKGHGTAGRNSRSGRPASGHHRPHRRPRPHRPRRMGFDTP